MGEGQIGFVTWAPGLHKHKASIVHYAFRRFEVSHLHLYLQFCNFALCNFAFAVVAFGFAFAVVVVGKSYLASL